MTALSSPLLNPATSPLDPRQQSVVQRVSDAERAHILALPSNDPLDPKLRRRVEATGPELFGQPSAITATISGNDAALTDVAHRMTTGIRRVVLVGCGDSLAVMVAARQALENALQVPCEPMQSLEFAYYHSAGVDAETAVIALSSSGETTRTVEALLVAQLRGAYTVSLTNTDGSTLQTEADRSLKVEATRVGWPTQSSTAALALLFELAVRIGEIRNPASAAPMRAALDGLPDLMGETLERLDPVIAAIAADEVRAGMQIALFAGAGPNLATAIVGAAKVKECTTLHAIDIQTEEYHHYNSQKAGEPLFLFAPSGPSVPRAVDTGTDALRWNGRLYVFTTDGEEAFDGLAGTVVPLPAIDETLSPLVYLLAAQLIGYHLGLASYAAAADG
ncbi:SIS domain-containing protein [Mycolicibacterium sp. 018/SC-01/001]|uniref:SIS domain-containing protein n=1 Tax=Mycolicibacterium sp. 018/SC-01/001 TaxID=2592069 RepID=UPI00117C090B|nr:SIS domain-containing protein [Mycolicibacterium sp. 018/SC-01/001]TRW76962.1 SIS domain-containing protein [Mycolicibacterium sp. 018/SC-01/001]